MASTDTIIDSGSGVAITGTTVGGGTNRAFSDMPSTAGLATNGTFNGKVMTWGTVFFLPSTTPVTDAATL